jgi:hypothetical protein
MFVLRFLECFADVPLSQQENLSKSNWTQHVYYAIRSAAKAMALGCTFETMGRLDAVIDTLGDYPGVILVAEWESDSGSVFGANNELDKLWKAANQHCDADSLLFTYADIEQLQDFTKQAVAFWQSQSSGRESRPSLFLITIVTQREKRSQKFLFIRTMEIAPSVVRLWYDLPFVDTTEYLKHVERL